MIDTDYYVEAINRLEAMKLEALEFQRKADGYHNGNEQKEIIGILSRMLHEQCETNYLLLKVLNQI